MREYFLRIIALLIITASISSHVNHPIYMTVTEIEHNAKDKILEITCKLFTNDFENQLKKNTAEKVDLLNPSLKLKMSKMVETYLQTHLKIALNDKGYAVIKFIGFEQVEDAIVCYFEMDEVDRVNKVVVWNNLLYEYSNQQINLVHVTVNGNRKSYRLNYPDTKLSLDF